MPPALALVWALVHAPEALSTGVTSTLDWAPVLGLALSFRLDALSLGASAFSMFWRVTLPKIRWGLLYGVILLNARAIGEFGAVSVVSGNIRGQTNTIPLQVEILYNEYNFAAAFAVASVLTLLAVVTLILKSLVAWRLRES